METTTQHIKAIVQDQMMKIKDPFVKSALEEILIEPCIHIREWDYGTNGEEFECWTIAVDHFADTSLIYCEYGFGPECPWGLVFSSMSHFGMDSSWFTSLEDCFLESRTAAELPIWFIERRFESGKSEIIAENLTSDEAFLIINNRTKENKEYHVKSRK